MYLGSSAESPERLAQLLDGCVDALVELDHRVVRPELSLDFFAGDNLAVALDQHQQDLKRLLLQRYGANPIAQLGAADVEFEASEAYLRGQGVFHGSTGERNSGEFTTATENCQRHLLPLVVGKEAERIRAWKQVITNHTEVSRRPLIGVSDFFADCAARVAVWALNSGGELAPVPALAQGPLKEQNMTRIFRDDYDRPSKSPNVVSEATQRGTDVLCPCPCASDGLARPGVCADVLRDLRIRRRTARSESLRRHNQWIAHGNLYGTTFAGGTGMCPALLSCPVAARCLSSPVHRAVYRPVSNSPED